MESRRPRWASYRASATVDRAIITPTPPCGTLSPILSTATAVSATHLPETVTLAQADRANDHPPAIRGAGPGRHRRPRPARPGCSYFTLRVRHDGDIGLMRSGRVMPPPSGIG